MDEDGEGLKVKALDRGKGYPRAAESLAEGKSRYLHRGWYNRGEKAVSEAAEGAEPSNSKEGSGGR